MLPVGLGTAWESTTPAGLAARISLVGRVGSFPDIKEVFLATYKVAVFVVLIPGLDPATLPTSVYP